MFDYPRVLGFDSLDPISPVAGGFSRRRPARNVVDGFQRGELARHHALYARPASAGTFGKSPIVGFPALLAPEALFSSGPLEQR
jgi:hypothetical protein